MRLKHLRLVKRIEEQKEILEKSIVILHRPDKKNIELLSGYNPFLILSGHTHNGQTWPINFITRMQYGKYHNGYNKVKNTHTFTTSGFGTSGMPCRFLNPPEIVFIHLE